MRIRLREKHDHRLRTLLDIESTEDGIMVGAPPEGVAVSETSRVVLQVYPDELENFGVRMWIGRVLAASTHVDSDRPLYSIELPLDVDDQPDHLRCVGRLFSDWAGQADCRFEVSSPAGWRELVTVRVHVLAGKIEQEAFEELCSEIASESAALLLDVYGKTYLGIQPTAFPGESAPIVMLDRIAGALEEFRACLRRIARQPVYRLRTELIREPLCPGHPVDYTSLVEACGDPSMLASERDAVVIREAVREVAKPNYDRLENRLLSGFLKFLERQLHDLRSRLDTEIRVRQERRRFRSARKGNEALTWWESEDLPRIKQLTYHKERTHQLQQQIYSLRRIPFLPPAGALSQIPASTPLLRSDLQYRRAFAVIHRHIQAYQVNLDEFQLLTFAKSLPQLYEWWCVLAVLRALHKHLFISTEYPCHPDAPFKVITEERRRFVIEFCSDQYVDYHDANGRLVRLRYEPRYVNSRRAGESVYGVLGLESERTPDIAIEIYEDKLASDSPRSIVVLDAKYSSWPQERKLQEVREKYAKIGRFDTGEVLSHQVWALMPSAPTYEAVREPEWAAQCTVDNAVFWSAKFDMGNPVCGAIQVKPLSGGGKSPLEALLIMLLDRLGVVRRQQGR